MEPEMTSRTPASKASRAPSSFPSLPSLSTARHAQFAESAKLEHLSAVALAKVEAINTNLPARRSAQREGGRGLGYGG